VGDGFQVLFGDKAVDGDDAFYEQLTNLEVEENADLPGAIQLTLQVSVEGALGFEDYTAVNDPNLKPYGHVAVLATPDGGDDACIFDGYILSHRLHVDAGTTSASLRVWGQDASCLMNVKDVVTPWTATDGNIANTIFGTYGFKTVQANTADDGPEHPDDERPLMQRATDAQFLRDRARRCGKLFRVACGKTAGEITGYFIKPDLGGDPVATLVLNPPEEANVPALEFEWDVARPVETLARAIFGKEEPEDGKTTSSGLGGLDERSLSEFISIEKGKMQAHLTTAVDRPAELKQRAAALLREAGWFVTCEGEADLSTFRHVLRVGTVVDVSGAGKLNSGKYFVWSVRHTINADAHKMRFVLVRNAVGRNT
jgi:hypothetical protein